jgi:GMP synthase (glutamine-hydrolysing)
MRHCIALRHVAFEGLGALAFPLEVRGWAVDVVDVADPEDVPPAAVAADLLILLGGPDSVYDHPPYIDAEIDLSRRRIADGRATLGICLGAQILAAALGAEVRRGPVPEIGWHLVVFTPEAEHDPVMRHLAEWIVLQWHGDTFELPDGAVRLARSADYENQGFKYADLTYALQFHPEVTSEELPLWVEGYREMLARTPAAQSPEMILARARIQDARTRTQVSEFMEAYLDAIERNTEAPGDG